VLPPHQLIELFRPELSGLPKHLVYESRFAVIDVSNDGDISNIVPLHKSVRINIGARGIERFV
jgi:hypothetical protein